MLNVVKLSGRSAEDSGTLRATVERVAALPGRTVVVHGGGTEISAWQRRLDLPVTWHEGLRVTTSESLRVTAMVLSGWVNKRVVQAFEDAGVPAVGISGEDGSLLNARRAHGGAIGEVGEVVGVRPGAIHALVKAGFVPVVSPVSRGPEGSPLNVNADEAALWLAAALAARRIYLVSDVPGVVVGGRAVETLTPVEARALLAEGVARDGMAVKLRQALVAAEAGVEVAIGDASILENFTAGTRILGTDVTVEVA